MLRELGALFAAARRTSGLSLKAISGITEISPSHILRMESGEQDFTVTKFSRLCDALGIPVGLALECSRLHTREFFRKNAPFHAESPQLAIKLFGGVYNKASAIDAEKLSQNTTYSEAIEWLLVTASRTVAALLMSANPELLARQVHGPPAAVRERLLSFAGRIDPLASVTERLGILKSLAARPYSKLKALGILDDKIVFDYIVSKAYKSSYEPSFNIQRFLLAEPETAGVLDSDLEGAAKPSLKLDLTETLTQSNIADVKPLWPALKRRLQSATSETGKKTELAKFLKLDLTRVSQWLTDSKSSREPGAEYALQMLHWVEQQERQK